MYVQSKQRFNLQCHCDFNFSSHDKTLSVDCKTMSMLNAFTGSHSYFCSFICNMRMNFVSYAFITYITAKSSWTRRNSLCSSFYIASVWLFNDIFNPHVHVRRAARGELQLLVHCYTRNRAACAQQVFCKMHSSRESSKIPTSLMPLIYRRALFAQRFNATTATVMAL